MIEMAGESMVGWECTALQCRIRCEDFYQKRIYDPKSLRAIATEASHANKLFQLVLRFNAPMNCPCRMPTEKNPKNKGQSTLWRMP
jgi:hypothetical protein